MTDSQRTFLNSILTFIGATSLTDDEAESVSVTGTFYDVESYTALSSVLSSRGTVSGESDRLRFFYLAKNVPVGDTPISKSNIFIGATLE